MLISGNYYSFYRAKSKTIARRKKAIPFSVSATHYSRYFCSKHYCLLSLLTLASVALNCLVNNCSPSLTKVLILPSFLIVFPPLRTTETHRFPCSWGPSAVYSFRAARIVPSLIGARCPAKTQGRRRYRPRNFLVGLPDLNQTNCALRLCALSVLSHYHRRKALLHDRYQLSWVF
jgi:hypothetical protein